MPETLKVRFDGAEIVNGRFTVYRVQPMIDGQECAPIELVRWPRRDPDTGVNLEPTIDVQAGTVQIVNPEVWTIGNPGPSRLRRFFLARPGNTPATLAAMTGGSAAGEAGAAPQAGGSATYSNGSQMAGRIADIESNTAALAKSLGAVAAELSGTDGILTAALRDIAAHFEKLKKPIVWSADVGAFLSAPDPGQDEEIPF